MKRVLITAAIASIVPLLALALVLPGLRLEPAEAQAPALASHRFTVEFDGLRLGQFKSVSGLSFETEVVEYREGGTPEVVRKLPGRTKYQNIVLKQGFTRNPDALYQWYQEIIGGTVKKRPGSIILLGSDGKEVGRYNLYEAWPCKWQGIEGVGNGSAIAIETIEIAVDRIEKA